MVARRIEIKLNLSHGWMDQPHVDCQLTEIENPPKPKQPSAPVTATEPQTTMDASTPTKSLEQAPETNTLSSLLDALSHRLEQADPTVRQEVMQLVMRYIENPDAGARIVRAIEQLLRRDDLDSAA